MLKPDYLFHCADRVVEIYEKLNQFAVNDICRRLANTNFQMTGTIEWQYYLLQQSGMCRAEIQKQIAATTKKSQKEVARLFEEAGVRAYDADSKVYREAGVTPLPFDQSKNMLDILQATYEQTDGELQNFTKTAANSSEQIFRDACDDAYIRVRTGQQSYGQAIKEAIDRVAADGLYVGYPSGHRDTVETAVRRAVMTGVNQASIRMTIAQAKDMGTNYVVVSSHLGARTGDGVADHAGWQGKVYKIEEKKEGFFRRLSFFKKLLKRDYNYPLLEDATGYPGNPLGLGGYNCRHSIFPFVPGTSVDNFEQYDSEENRKAYVLSQGQRRKERDIRKTKRQLQALEQAMEACLDGEEKQQLQKDYDQKAVKLKRQNAAYRGFCQENDLPTQADRMRTAGWNQEQARRAVAAARRAEKASSHSFTAGTEKGIK